MTFTLLNDQPIGAGQNRDLLNVREVAKEIAALLIASREAAPLTVAVDASWGRGKSSLLYSLRNELGGTSGVQTVWFNAWTSEGVSALEGLIKSVLGELDSKVVHGMLRRTQRRRSLLGALRMTTAIALRLVGLESLIDQLWERLSADAHSRNEMRELVGKALEEWVDEGRATGGRILVVFIDELDRCTRQVIVEVCEAIKLYLNVPGIVFIIGCDHDALTQGAMREDAAAQASSGRDYLEKIIQVSYRIPTPREEQIRQLIEGYAEQSGTADLFDETTKILISERTGRNFRRIKRLINSFILEYRLDPDWHRLGAERLIKVLLLQHFYPEFYRQLITASEEDPIGEFLDYHTVRDEIASLTTDNHELWDTVHHVFGRYQVMVPEDAEALYERMPELERQLPEHFPNLVRDTEFVSLLQSLGTHSERALLRDQLLRKPLTPVPPTDDMMPAFREESVHNERTLQGLDVLWIDDNNPKGNQTEIRAIEAEGARIHIARDLTEAQMVLSSASPDVIISDITRDNDPDAGFKDLDQLRDAGTYLGPVIFYSGRVTPHRRERARELQAIGVTTDFTDVLNWLALARPHGSSPH